jgi:hypothetical protein
VHLLWPAGYSLAMTDLNAIEPAIRWTDSVTKATSAWISSYSLSLFFPAMIATRIDRPCRAVKFSFDTRFVQL